MVGSSFLSSKNRKNFQEKQQEIRPLWHFKINPYLHIEWGKEWCTLICTKHSSETLVHLVRITVRQPFISLLQKKTMVIFGQNLSIPLIVIYSAWISCLFCSRFLSYLDLNPNWIKMTLKESGKSVRIEYKFRVFMVWEFLVSKLDKKCNAL